MTQPGSPGTTPEGFAVVDKEAGWTSHDVVARARRLLGVRKVGHAGTLDPDATGVLVLGVGRATRLLRFVTALGKVYEASVVFGAETHTGDAAGEVTGTWDMAALTEAQARTATAGFVGDIMQVPPMVSALKVDGRRLHELAREGRTVERAARPVRVDRFEVTGFVAGPRPVATVTVACSAGTYVRTLAADWGRTLGGGAHLGALRRTAVGSFGVGTARPLEQLELLSPADGLRDYPSLRLDAAGAAAVVHGRSLPGGEVAGEGPWAVLDPAGALLAVYVRRGEQLRPVVVLPPASPAPSSAPSSARAPEPDTGPGGAAPAGR